MHVSPSLASQLPLAEISDLNRELYLERLAIIRTQIIDGTLSPTEFQKEITFKGEWRPSCVEELLGFDDHVFQSLNQISYPNNTDSFPYMKSMAYLPQVLLKHCNLTPADTFYDLGSGGGFPCLLMHLASGCRTVGVEIQEALCSAAEQKARDLNLSKSVSFKLADASEVNYQDGTVFYFFNPFQGETMKKVIDQLHQLSLQKEIVIFNATWCSDGARLPELFDEVLKGRIYKSKS